MELNLLFLPLLGGYIFYTRWNVTKFASRRCSGERLIFHSAAVGLGLLIFARVCALLIREVASSEGIARISAEAMGAFCLLTIVAALISASPKTRRRRSATARYKWRRSTEVVLGAVFLVSVFAFAIERLPGGLASRVLSSLFSAVILAIPVEIGARVLSKLDAFLPLRILRLRLTIVVGSICGCLLVAATHGHDLLKAWSDFSPYTESGTAFLACVAGAIGWWPINVLYCAKAAIRRMHLSQQTSALDRLIYSAAEEGALVQFNMQDGKFYVGYIGEIPNDPDATNALIEFLPIMSGYRDPTTKVVQLTTFYDQVYDALEDSDDVGDFYRTIPTAQVVSAGRFRQDLYLRFAGGTKNEGESNANLASPSETVDAKASGTTVGPTDGKSQ